MHLKKNNILRRLFQELLKNKYISSKTLTILIVTCFRLVDDIKKSWYVDILVGTVSSLGEK